MEELEKVGKPLLDVGGGGGDKGGLLAEKNEETPTGCGILKRKSNWGRYKKRLKKKKNNRERKN